MEIYYYIATYFTKDNSSGTKTATERSFLKTANPDLQKRQITYNLKTLEKYQ